MSANQILPEDILKLKWNRCFTDTLVKLGGGLIIGGVTSLLLFKRKMWPVTFGTAFGLGMALGNCQNEFAQPNFIHADYVKLHDPASDKMNYKEEKSE